MATTSSAHEASLHSHDGDTLDSEREASRPVKSEAAPASESPTHPKLRQWVQVLCAFVVFLNTWGLLLSFGAFESYYKQSLFSSYSSSDISWILTVAGFLIMTSGLVTGPLYDQGYLRPLLVAGSILETFGLMMTSLATKYYQAFLAQGVCVGLGGGLLYVPVLSAVAASFPPKTRAKVMGLIASATGIGGVIYPIMFRQLVPTVGFPWAVRSIGFILLGTYALSYLSLANKPPASPAGVRKWFDTSAFTDIPFLCITASGFLNGTAYFMPLLYIPTFAADVIHVNDSLAFYLLSIMNGVSILSRLGAGFVASRIGPTETSTLAVFFCAILLFSWTAVTTQAGLIAWVVIWGLASSLIVSMPGAFVPLFSPMQLIGTRMGMFWTSVATGILIGGPIGGALIDQHGDAVKWWPLSVCAGVIMLASVALSVYPIVYIRRKQKAAAAAA